MLKKKGFQEEIDLGMTTKKESIEVEYDPDGETLCAGSVEIKRSLSRGSTPVEGVLIHKDMLDDLIDVLQEIQEEM